MNRVRHGSVQREKDRYRQQRRDEDTKLRAELWAARDRIEQLAENLVRRDQELAEARKDTERLDGGTEWQGQVGHDARGWWAFVSMKEGVRHCKTFREAIDAAMKPTGSAPANQGE